MADKTRPIERLIDSMVSCILCGSPGVGNCDCWEHCSCGHWARAGTPCRNTRTTKCSTKVKYGTHEFDDE